MILSMMRFLPPSEDFEGDDQSGDWLSENNQALSAPTEDGQADGIEKEEPDQPEVDEFNSVPWEEFGVDSKTVRYFMQLERGEDLKLDAAKLSDKQSIDYFMAMISRMGDDSVDYVQFLDDIRRENKTEDVELIREWIGSFEDLYRESLNPVIVVPHIEEPEPEYTQEEGTVFEKPTEGDGTYDYTENDYEEDGDVRDDGDVRSSIGETVAATAGAPEVEEVNDAEVIPYHFSSELWLDFLRSQSSEGMRRFDGGAVNSNVKVEITQKMLVDFAYQIMSDLGLDSQTKVRLLTGDRPLTLEQFVKYMKLIQANKLKTSMKIRLARNPHAPVPRGEQGEQEPLVLVIEIPDFDDVVPNEDEGGGADGPKENEPEDDDGQYYYKLSDIIDSLVESLFDSDTGEALFDLEYFVSWWLDVAEQISRLRSSGFKDASAAQKIRQLSEESMFGTHHMDFEFLSSLLGEAEFAEGDSAQLVFISPLVSQLLRAFNSGSNDAMSPWNYFLMNMFYANYKEEAMRTHSQLLKFRKELLKRKANGDAGFSV